MDYCCWCRNFLMEGADGVGICMLDNELHSVMGVCNQDKQKNESERDPA